MYMSKFKRFISVVLCAFLLCTLLPIEKAEAAGFTVSVESVSGSFGQQIVVPVKFSNVPSNGIITADMTITYDSSKLEYVSGEAGSIVTNPSINYAINKDKDGSIKVLFLDDTLTSGYISRDGVFTNLTFKVISSASTTATVTVNKANFGDRNLSPITAQFSAGTITLNSGNSTIPTTQPTTPPWTQPTTPPQNSSGNFSVNYSQNSWGTGATVSMTITNNGSSAVNGWTVNFTFPGNQKITNAWNCTYTQSGSSVTINNVDYNAVIPAGGSVTIGFNISYSGTNEAPTNFIVNSSSVNPGNPTQPPFQPTLPPTSQPSTGPIVTGFTAYVESVTASAGEQVVVPIKLANVPSNGITTADMTITYDASKLEYVKGEAGSIVINPSINFAINKEKDGIIRILFLDDTLLNEYISKDGVFANITFKVSGTSTVTISKATFGDRSLKPVSATLTAGTVTVGGGTTQPTSQPTTGPIVTGFTAYVESVTASAGEQVVVPIKLANVPSNGITTADMTITYDASKLEYVKGEAGSIVINPSINFAINKEKDGIIRILFLDDTLLNEYISKDGVFANITFKVSGTSTVTISKATFGDRSLKPVSATLTAGTVTVGGGTTQPTVPPTSQPTTGPIVTGFTAYVESVTASAGEQVVVPIKLANVPSNGITTADMTITYDSSKPE
ncbi:cohesin domain-containing protein [Acetivibrio clariflavus]|uniref:cohesin domain-containing protein n=1 Tax=Acetivibrio clariflavus TaxID=288965 RepID=UPI0031F48728